MLKKTTYLFLLFILIGISGCFTAGTHGSIKNYQYSLSKYELEKSVQKIITTNQNIQRDTIKSFSDSTKYDYYNDGNYYLSVSIKKNKLVYEYIIKYGGNKEYWDSSKVSNLFICYAYDGEGNGGSEGNGGLPWYKFGLKKNLIGLFESEFVSKIDSVLMQKHIETD